MSTEKNSGIIYKATNIINGKMYIGQTIKGLSVRKNIHLNTAKRKNCMSYFHRSIIKYGPENFDWNIICNCTSRTELNKMEIWYINEFNTFKPNGYNLTLGGGGISGWKHTEKTKEKQSIAKIGDKNPMKQPEAREKVRNKLTGRTKETHEYIKKSNEKKSQYNKENSEWIRKRCIKFNETMLSMSINDRKLLFGRKQTDKQKQKMSILRKGKNKNNCSRVKQMSETKKQFFSKLDSNERKILMGKTKGMSWYHNDVEEKSKMFFPNMSTENWIKGRKFYENKKN